MIINHMKDGINLGENQTGSFSKNMADQNNDEFEPANLLALQLKD